MVRNHIVDNMMISESFVPDLQYTVKTKENIVNIMRKNDKVMVNNFFNLLETIKEQVL